MVTSDLLPLDAFYSARAVTAQGDAHRQVNVNNQDHAVALACPDGVVLVVADGVSTARDLSGSLHAATSAAEVVSSLTLVLDYPGPVLSAYVATDGLRHEPAAATGLRERVLRQSGHLSLTRPKDCDDIAVAWASTHVAGLIADDDLDLDQLAAAIAQDLNAGGAS